MRALLKSQGYFEPVIRDTFNIDTVKQGARHPAARKRKVCGKSRQGACCLILLVMTLPHLNCSNWRVANRNKALVKKGNNLFHTGHF